jgi:hypothetical protein
MSRPNKKESIRRKKLLEKGLIICSHCKQTLKLKFFYKNRNQINGFHNWCKRCVKKSNTVYNKIYRNTINKKAIINYSKLRKKVLNLLGNKCKYCGNSDYRCIQIDHKKGNGVREVHNFGNAGIYRKILKNSHNYQLLCANCNWIKRFKNNETGKGKHNKK